MPIHIGAALLTLGCCIWLVIPVVVAANIRRTARVERLASPPPAQWPKISVVIPACNEADTLEAAMRVRAHETYPNIEFVVVDDRSTDATGAIADRFAAQDPRVRVVHVTALPEGWLGKVHALHQGVEHSDGEWILFTDADVHVQPGALERIVAWGLEQDADQITLLPRMEARSFGMKMAGSLFLRIAMTSALVAKVENPKSRLAAGGGAFCLFRREALDLSPGMPRLRLEVIDDIGLGFLLKAYGARCRVVNGVRDVSVLWYPTLRAMKSGLEKNGFAIANYNLFLLLAMCTAMLLIEWAPFAALATGRPCLQALGAISATLGLAVTACVSRWANVPVIPALLYPLAAPIIAYFLLRAGILATRRHGIIWRGTLYPLKDLRAFRGIR